MKITHPFLTKLFVCSLVFLSAVSVHAENNASPVVVTFTRHTFRGVDYSMPAAVSSFDGLDLKNNVLAYEENATSIGLKITQQFAKRAYNNGARLALKTIGENPKLAGHWSSIRPDLAAQRTFETAVYLDSGLAKISKQKIAFIGVPIQGYKASDDISSISDAQEACYPQASWSQQTALIRNAVTTKYTPIANQLVEIMGGTPSDSNPSFFSHVLLLSSLIEFNSDFKNFSLSDVVPHVYQPPAEIQQADKDSLDLVGYDLFQAFYGLTSDVFSLAKINFINTLPAGTQQIIVTHDDNISSLLQSLGLISIYSKPGALAIYPLESLTFALNNSRVAIVRTRIKIDPSGSITGAAGYQSTVVWSGTRQAWNKKIAAIQSNINQFPSIAHCLAKIPAPKTVTMKLRLADAN